MSKIAKFPSVIRVHFIPAPDLTDSPFQPIKTDDLKKITLLAAVHKAKLSPNQKLQIVADGGSTSYSHALAYAAICEDCLITGKTTFSLVPELSAPHSGFSVDASLEPVKQNAPTDLELLTRIKEETHARFPDVLVVITGRSVLLRLVRACFADTDTGPHIRLLESVTKTDFNEIQLTGDRTIIVA